VTLTGADHAGRDRAMPHELSLRVLNRTLLERQGLLRRWRVPPLDAIERLVGMQAQEPNDPYVGLWSRLVGFDPAALGRLLTERQAVRIALMRATIHLVSAEDCRTLWPLTERLSQRTFSSTAFARSVDGVDVAEALALARRLLEEQPLPPKALGLRLAERWPDRDPVALAMLARYRLPLVQVPPRGVWGRSMRTTNSTAEAWLGAPLATDPSPDAVVLRYLAAFGPASVADARAWSGLSGLREVFERLRPRLRTFRDDRGRELFDLPDAPIAVSDAPAPPRFLPLYDNAALGHDDRRRIVSDRDRRRPDLVDRTLLVDGFVGGTWRLVIERGGDAARLRVRTLRRLAPAERAELDEEGRGLLAFLAPDASSSEVELVEC
jgi:hypothetical protein